MTIQGVTFDWWGTIAVIPAQSDAGAMRAFRIARLEGKLRDRGLRPARSALLEAYDRQTDVLEGLWAEHRELSPDEQVRSFMQFAGLDAADAEVVPVIGEAIHAAIVSRPPATFPDIEETLHSLSEHGLEIGLISNTGRSWGRYLTDVQDAKGIGRYFRTRVYSNCRDSWRSGDEGDGRGPPDSGANQVPRSRGPDPPPPVPRFDQRLHRPPDDPDDDRVR